MTCSIKIGDTTIKLTQSEKNRAKTINLSDYSEYFNSSSGPITITASA